MLSTSIARIGPSIALIAIGAILAFAVAGNLVNFIDLTLVGYILMGVGILGLVVSLLMSAPRNQRRISESRTVRDPTPASASPAMKQGMVASNPHASQCRLRGKYTEVNLVLLLLWLTSKSKHR